MNQNLDELINSLKLDKSISKFLDLVEEKLLARVYVKTGFSLYKASKLLGLTKFKLHKRLRYHYGKNYEEMFKALYTFELEEKENDKHKSHKTNKPTSKARGKYYQGTS